MANAKLIGEATEKVFQSANKPGPAVVHLDLDKNELEAIIYYLRAADSAENIANADVGVLSSGSLAASAIRVRHELKPLYAKVRGRA